MWKKLTSQVTAVDVLFFTGAALLSLGAGLAAGLPVGLMVSGGFCLLASVLSDRKDGGKQA